VFSVSVGVFHQDQSICILRIMYIIVCFIIYVCLLLIDDKMCNLVVYEGFRTKTGVGFNSFYKAVSLDLVVDHSTSILHRNIVPAMLLHSSMLFQHMVGLFHEKFCFL